MRLFRAADPKHASVGAFREEVAWNSMDLKRMAKEGKSIDREKIATLYRFLRQHDLPSPLPQGHPAAIILSEVRVEELEKEVARSRERELQMLRELVKLKK